MNDRFHLEWERQAERILDVIIEVIAGVDHILVDAFSASADLKLEANSVVDVKRNLRWIVTVSAQLPWVYYDTISNLVIHLPPATRAEVIEHVKIPTGHPHEFLRVDENGDWKLSWEISSGDSEQAEWIELIWYQPPLRDHAPIVPIPILDYIAGCVAMLRGDLILPAAALMSIALEAALWDALLTKNISRFNEKINYRAVEWRLRKLSSNLVVTIDGADKDLSELGKALGKEVPQFTLTLRRMQTNEDKDKVVLQFDADAQVVDFLASNEEDSRKTKPKHGLSVAIQRGRKEQIESLKIMPPPVDDMLVPLRNNLVHLALEKKELYEPVPTPEGEITTLDDLRANHGLVRDLLSWITELIDSVYATGVAIETVEDVEIGTS